MPSNPRITIFLSKRDAGRLPPPEQAIDAAAAAKRLAAEIRALQTEDGLDAIVIGLPRRLNGEPNEQTARVRKLAELLAAEVTAPISLQDERLTSHEAEELLAARER